jgi:hypothetical protein
MATIPQIRNRLLEGFPEKQADLLAHVVIEAHDDLVNQADFHALTSVVKELADSQKELADSQHELANAQKRTEQRVEELAGAQTRTEQILSEVVTTQKKMLIRLDRLDGHMLEDQIAKNLPAFLGREFRRCRVLQRAEFVESLEDRLPEDLLADLMRADAIATAKRAEQLVHIVVEASCTADSDDVVAGSWRYTQRTKIVAFQLKPVLTIEKLAPPSLFSLFVHS